MPICKAGCPGRDGRDIHLAGEWQQKSCPVTGILAAAAARTAPGSFLIMETETPKPKTNPTPRGESGKRGMSQASEPLHSPDCTLRSAHMAQRVLTRCGPCDTYAEIPSVKGQPETQLTQSCFLWQATPGTTRFNHPSECHASAVAQQSHGSRRRLFSRLNGHSETTRHLQDSTSQNSRRCFPACMSPPVHVMPC